jgi:predicted nuclease with RNAse H fold
VLERLRQGDSGTANVVVLSNWNRKAVDLLSQAGIHVVVIDAPLEIAEIRREGSLDILLQTLQSLPNSAGN